MLNSNIQVELIYQLVFVLLLLTLALVFFTILVRYTGWLKIHFDRISQLYKIDTRAIESSLYSLTIIAKSKGMEIEESEESEEDKGSKMPKGKYKEFTNI